jgi:hypothetical protein
VVEQEVEVTDTSFEVGEKPVTRTEKVPRVVETHVEEIVVVPEVKEVPVTREVQVPTGR